MGRIVCQMIRIVRRLGRIGNRMRRPGCRMGRLVCLMTRTVRRKSRIGNSMRRPCYRRNMVNKNSRTDCMKNRIHDR
jgi:hypothetical protein